MRKISFPWEYFFQDAIVQVNLSMKNDAISLYYGKPQMNKKNFELNILNFQYYESRNNLYIILSRMT